jgi:hypothetical protein
MCNAAVAGSEHLHHRSTSITLVNVSYGFDPLVREVPYLLTRNLRCVMPFGASTTRVRSRSNNRFPSPSSTGMRWISSSSKSPALIAC